MTKHDSSETHISSLVIQCRPVMIDEVKLSVNAMPYTTIEGEDPVGKLVALLETPSRFEVTETIDQIRGLTGILSVTMVYHHMEATTEIDRLVPDMPDVLPSQLEPNQ